MNVEWTNMTGFGPTAWNHGGAPVTILMKHPQKEEKTGRVASAVQHHNALPPRAGSVTQPTAAL
ncbi:hypothetical protein PDESU_06076 [Pontiella desulfatans]|uniref:Uncharacterized protein n=1 Tax=Pontiella desulfatans TaxID=2750659 RepID=A0A6C2UBL6_PONDE|nr:hypothetical protein [Pontiella desulfatans]VGO17480.1 hypothetical protein PDESU_06076 [Pontiella desulfatans]